MSPDYIAAVKDLQVFVTIARRVKLQRGAHSPEYRRARIALDRAYERYEDIVAPQETRVPNRNRSRVISRIYEVAA